MRLEQMGHKVLLLDEKATRHGAVETVAEARRYAEFLSQARGTFGGVILCLPNFGDETGAAVALQDAGVPILIQAYPDELDKMGPAVRRDAFCGKLSIMDLFHQYGIKFTALQPHTVSPASGAFEANIVYFDRLCRVVAGLRRMTVGAIGARTTAFKTVRIDELALQRHGITMETLDLSDVFLRIDALDAQAKAVREKAAFLKNYTDFSAVPENAIINMARLGVALDQITEEFRLDALAIRCWIELQKKLHISPCTLLSELNNRGVVTSCEVDIGSAIMMRALRMASGQVTTCLDWNNNFGDDPEKCILFHCGPVPQQMMKAKGTVTDHSMLAHAVGPGCSWGCNTGRIAAMPISFGNLLTQDGKIKCYVGEGRFTDDEIAEDFFGCAGVAEIPNLQNLLQMIGHTGHRHHVAVTPSHVANPIHEALREYLGYEVTKV
jgi:L-fucose isomerase-like protein